MFAFKIQTNRVTMRNKVLNSFEQLEHWKPLLNLFIDSKITWNSKRKTVNCLKIMFGAQACIGAQVHMA